MSDDRPRADDPRFRRPPPGEPSQFIPRDPHYRPPAGRSDEDAPTRRLPPVPPQQPPQQPPVPPGPPRQHRQPRPARGFPAQPAPEVRRPRPPRTERPAPPPGKPAPAPAPPKRLRRKQTHWFRRLAGLLLVLLLGGLAAGVGVGWWLDRSLHRIPALADYPDRPGAGRGTNWLLVGSDSRQGLTPEQEADLSTGGDLGDGRTDTIMLVHVPAVGSSAHATMVSIPRDSYVPIPDYGKDKINAAFSIGGAPLLAQTVELATGVHIDHYVEIGFGGFAGVVDALGGITVCPTEPIDDPLAGINLPAGCQNLNGAGALGYVRSRATPRADLDRMQNQRAFMAALLHRAASPAVWLNPWRWYAVPHAAAAALTVDNSDRIWDLARLAWSLHDAPTTLTVPIGEYTTAGSGDVVIWDHQVAAELFDALIADGPVPQSALDAQP